MLFSHLVSETGHSLDPASELFGEVWGLQKGV